MSRFALSFLIRRRPSRAAGAALRLLLAGSLLGAGACHRRAHVAKPAVAQKAAQAQGPDHQGEGNGTGAGLGANADEDTDNPLQRFHEATIYVDGEPRVAFSYNELPASVKWSEFDWSGEGDKARHALIADLIKAVGVDLKDVKATHWYGGRDRIAIISGDDLRKHHRSFYFDFTRDTFGKPRVEWRAAMHTQDMVDIVTDLCIYVHKQPPTWDREDGIALDSKGQPIEGIPYSKEEMPRRSVRVNVDGRLTTFIKRNLLEGNVQPIDPKAKVERFRLNEVLASKQVNAAEVHGLELITRDERVVRLSPEEVKAGVEFEMVRHAGGVIEAYFGTAGQTHHVSTKAINVYVKSAQPNREMRTLTLGLQARRGGVDSHPRSEKSQ